MEEGIQSAAAAASTPTPSVSPPDFPAKKLTARQLDFTALCSAAPTAAVASVQPAVTAQPPLRPSLPAVV